MRIPSNKPKQFQNGLERAGVSCIIDWEDASKSWEWRPARGEQHGVTPLWKLLLLGVISLEKTRSSFEKGLWGARLPCETMTSKGAVSCRKSDNHLWRCSPRMRRWFCWTVEKQQPNKKNTVYPFPSRGCKEPLRRLELDSQRQKTWPADGHFLSNPTGWGRHLSGRACLVCVCHRHGGVETRKLKLICWILGVWHKNSRDEEPRTTKVETSCLPFPPGSLSF